ncbi:protein of unknown function [Malonomonas rubra DSM 5091]|uniref:PatA-like N-terminal domain-containing protein n=1 Tax=Malonomonas rubra DSM 5091 TaxID=1122189 RepID=A0A1M6KG17_MALRU|nr:DUF4388 domain-containing protein [Malonomonas rubra]SHJ57837.1 protein of unknown function [Malonomonas rubra DSM 5091]
MPLTGELEHLPIVDVIQLIYTSRKSGTLNVYSRKGEGQLLFNQGYIVGATHSNEELRIGQILSEAGIVTTDDLDKALEMQREAGDSKKPLIATLIEYCGMSKETAFKALETLIEMTIVEMIGWTKGIFSLEMEKIHIFDEYRYLPDHLQDLNLDTQMVLMDALRIFDEKVHAGEINLAEEEEACEEPTEDIEISEDILGLADLDKVERKKPHVFKSLPAFDYSELHRQIVETELSHLSDPDKFKIIELLSELSKSSAETESTGSRSQAIVMFGDDSFAQHVVMTVCQKHGVLFFSASDNDMFLPLVDRAWEKDIEPLLLFDSNEIPEDLKSSVQQKYGEILQMMTLSAESQGADIQGEIDFNSTHLHTIYKPQANSESASYINELTEFINTAQNHLQQFCNAPRRQQFINLQNSLYQLKNCSKAQDISLQALQFVGDFFERSQTLIISKGELISERSIGITRDKADGVCAAQKIKVPLVENSILQKVRTSGKIFFDSCRDSTIEEHLFHEIGAPLDSKLFLAPLIVNNRTVTLTYADFGNETACPVPIDLVEFFFNQAGPFMQKALAAKTTKA